MSSMYDHAHTEELRALAVEQLKEINSLKNEIALLKQLVAEESDAKYRAYVKIADYQRQLRQYTDTVRE